jgi:FkbM family methyltransferase
MSARLAAYLLLGKIQIVEARRNHMSVNLPGIGKMEGIPRLVLRAAVGIYRDDYWRKLEVKNGLVVDVGGFIGDTAICFVSKGARKVYVLEPSRELCELARRNLAKYPNVVVLNVGAGVSERELFLTGEFMGKRENRSSKGESSTVIDFWGFLRRIISAEGEICAVKMDCEGCEKDIFRTIQPEVLSKIKSLAIEFHGDEGARIDFARRFQREGYNCALVGSVIVMSREKRFGV